VDTNGIMQLLVSGNSWEQIIYRIIAWEGLDPWDLDLNALADAFMDYLNGIKELDFKVPAKFIIVASVLLRMKTDHLNFLEVNGDDELVFADEDAMAETKQEPFEVNPITVPPRRQISRRVMVTELISSLKRVLRAQERKELKTVKAKGKIKIREDKLSKRIAELYRKIGLVLNKIKEDEVEFSKLVPKWEKKVVVNTFLPLIYLDSDKRISCRQEEMFDEIYIKKLTQRRVNT
jgi:segregation and condensation protein A